MKPLQAPVIVEVLARNGEVITRHEVAEAPIRIGRGYANDVVLDDPYVAAHHLTIEPDPSGAWTARDMESENGLYQVGAKTGRQTQVPLTGDTVIRIGHTLLRVRDRQHPVAPALLDTTTHAWEGAPPIATALVGVATASIASTWLADTEGKEALQYVIALIPTTMGLLIWATLWSVLNRIFAGRIRFGRHLFIASCAFVAAWLIEELSASAAFAFSWETLSRFSFVWPLAVMGVALGYHLRTVRPHATGLAKLVAVGVVLGGAGLTLVNNYVHHRRLGDELYMSGLKPPQWRASADVSSETFFKSIHELKDKVDRARAQDPVPNVDEDS